MHDLFLFFFPYFFQDDIDDFRYEIAYTLMSKWKHSGTAT